MTLLAVDTHIAATEALIRQAQESAAAAQLAADPMANYRTVSDLSPIQIHHVALNLQHMHKNVQALVPAAVLANLPRLNEAELNMQNQHLLAQSRGGQFEGMEPTQIDAIDAMILSKLNTIGKQIRAINDLWYKAMRAERAKIQPVLWRSVGVIPGGRTPDARAKEAVDAVEEHLMSLPGTERTIKPKKITPEYPDGGFWVNIDYQSVTEAHWITILATLKEARLQAEQTATEDLESKVCDYVDNGGSDKSTEAYNVEIGKLMGGPNGLTEEASHLVMTSISPTVVDRSDEQLAEPTEFEGFDNVKAAGDLTLNIARAQSRKAGAKAMARGVKLSRPAAGFTTDQLMKEGKDALIDIAQTMQECGYTMPKQCFSKRTSIDNLAKDIQSVYAGGLL